MGQVTRELEAIANGTDPSAVARESRPMRAESPRPAQITPASFTPSMTTLGEWRRRAADHAREPAPALIGGIVAGVAVLGVLVFVMTRGGSKSPRRPRCSRRPPR